MPYGYSKLIYTTRMTRGRTNLRKRGVMQRFSEAQVSTQRVREPQINRRHHKQTTGSFRMLVREEGFDSWRGSC
jgi:hypothetical protein